MKKRNKTVLKFSLPLSDTSDSNVWNVEKSLRSLHYACYVENYVQHWIFAAGFSLKLDLLYASYFVFWYLFCSI